MNEEKNEYEIQDLSFLDRPEDVQEQKISSAKSYTIDTGVYVANVLEAGIYKFLPSKAGGVVKNAAYIKYKVLVDMETKTTKEISETLYLQDNEQQHIKVAKDGTKKFTYGLERLHLLYSLATGEELTSQTSRSVETIMVNDFTKETAKAFRLNKLIGKQIGLGIVKTIEEYEKKGEIREATKSNIQIYLNKKFYSKSEHAALKRGEDVEKVELELFNSNYPKGFVLEKKDFSKKIANKAIKQNSQVDVLDTVAVEEDIPF